MYLMYPPVLRATHVRVEEVSKVQPAREGARKLYDLWGANRFVAAVRGLGSIDMVDDFGEVVRLLYRPTLKRRILFHLAGA